MIMRGLYLTDVGKLELRETPVPELSAGMVRIRVHRAGICATDLGYWKNGSPKLRLPVILGHEVSGVIEETADDVRQFRAGDRVIVTNDYHLCGRCRYCLGGAENMCVERRSIGSAENGAFADYMVVPARMVLPLPDALSFEEGALAEVIACGVHVLRCQAPVSPGDVVLVMGPGIMGVTAALAAKAMGCKVIVAGLHRDAARLQMALKLGIDRVVDLENEDLAAELDAISDHYGADVTIDGTGSARALETCLQLTAKRGTVVQLAAPGRGSSIDLSPIMMKELRYVGSYAKVRGDWELALQWMASGKLSCRPLISELVALEDYEKAFQTVASATAFKIMFRLCD